MLSSTPNQDKDDVLLARLKDVAAADTRLELTTEIVTAYLRRNVTPAAEIGRLIAETHLALAACRGGASARPADVQRPAVPVEKSLTDDFVICLEDGLKFKSMKRHLRTQYSLTPEDYRRKWDLPPSYPMVARNYAKKRSELARASGLGKRPIANEPVVSAEPAREIPSRAEKTPRLQLA